MSPENREAAGLQARRSVTHTRLRSAGLLGLGEVVVDPYMGFATRWVLMPNCLIRDPAALAAAANVLRVRWPYMGAGDAVSLACDQTGPDTFQFRPKTEAALRDRAAVTWRREQAGLRKQLAADSDLLRGYQKGLDEMAQEALTYVQPIEALAKALEARATGLLERLEHSANFRKVVNDVSQVVATILSFVPVVGELLSLAVTLGTLAWQMRQLGEVTTAQGERAKAGNPHRAQALINMGRALQGYGDLLESVEMTLRGVDGEWLNANRQIARMQAALSVPALVAPPPSAPLPGRAPLRTKFTLPRWAGPAAALLALWWWFR